VGAGPEAACLAAATEHWSLVVARGLRVNVGRMKENVQRLGGLLLSEAVMLKLARRSAGTRPTISSTRPP